jgi:hypothetical protein
MILRCFQQEPAINSAKALERAAESLLYKLPAAAAVQSSGQINLLIIRLRLRCPRDELGQKCKTIFGSEHTHSRNIDLA